MARGLGSSPEAAPWFREALVSYGDVRSFGVRGSAAPSPSYVRARGDFLRALRALTDLGVTAQEIATVLGISRSAVSQWVSKAEED